MPSEKNAKMSFSKDESEPCRAQHYDGMELTGSHFALQVALQTMKERCHRLQQRLSHLEEENSRLKSHKCDCEIDPHSGPSGDSSQQQLEQLKEQVTQLTSQKSQLSHQIIMVVTENKQLWNRLSHMTKVNKSLGGHLSKISDTLNQHTSGSLSNSPKKSKGDVKHPSQRGDSTSVASKNLNETNQSKKSGSEINSLRQIDGSLEEISLKLLNSIQQEKSELEQQYAQMVEMNNDTSPSFNLNTMGLSFVYEDENHAVKLIKENCKDLEKMKEALLDQQNALKSAIAKVTSLKEARAKSFCPQCLSKHGKWKEIDVMTDDGGIDNNLKLNEGEMKFKDQWTGEVNDDKLDNVLSVGNKESSTSVAKEQVHTCPMCGMKWAYSTPFEVFQKHVTDHFPPDNDDWTSIGNDLDMLA
ncbi:protein spindle-F [Ischnura elegans]|uniref:protein spindle-F n=1 Tax=Ischnura elegans TaxID=197161 RepID=UPI001ED8A92E|nr:protein spindle-F [Ischnura elegans]